MKFRVFQKLNVWQTIQLSGCLTVLIGALFYGFGSQKSVPAEENDKAAAIEKALFARTEFFGADAIVPLPTEQARNRLALILEKYPGDAEILLKLADLDEKLGRFDEAEAEIKSVEPLNLQALTDFYGRRGAFEKQAAALEQILQNAPAEKRGAAFSNLIYAAKKHDLKQYLAPGFYQKIIDGDAGSFSVFLEYVDKLSEEKNYSEALRILDETAAKFPEQRNYLLDKKISILTLQGKISEAEKVYYDDFNPFWTDSESEKFYEFLRENDRYRAYESGLRAKFRQNPADYQTAIRLIHFARNEGDEFGAIVQDLENARAGTKAWQADELLTISQFLIETGDGDSASRFLYTLCTDFEAKNNPDLRRKVLYQLFELLSDAGYEKLALTRGNLDFYESVVKSDVRPGITTGILSLIFSDTNPRREFNKKQERAVKFFNRAAAYRIFQEFKKDYPNAPELAQMYLDIVRLYTTTGNLEIAQQTLIEFEEKYADFKDFPDAALKLADAFIATEQFGKEREIYQKLLDFFGKSERRKFPPASETAETSDLTEKKPQILSYPPASNQGVNVSGDKKRSDYYYNEPNKYTNYLGSARGEIFYTDVLARAVASLARENKTQEILNLYARETEKYPDEPRLYEQMLAWLGQTNLGEKQFEVYQKALQNFPQKTWKDRFARWLIRNRRTEEFEDFSRAAAAKFTDAETEQYLKQFIDGGEVSDAKGFGGNLFFGLYSLAHKRFPHNIVFVRGLLRYYSRKNMQTEWRALLAEYYFESTEIRQEFLRNLAEKGEIRAFLQKSEDLSASEEIASLPYKLFRADASAQLSEFEKANAFYRELNQLYPNNAEFSENFLTLSRSFGQTSRNLQLEAANFAQKRAENFPADEKLLTTAGELQAELGDYKAARANWEKIVSAGMGENESYLNTATIFWDYFQFTDALETIKNLREKSANENLYAFQAGAILEAKNETSRAIAEYVKALDENDIEADSMSAKRRLKQLYPRANLARQIDSAFQAQRKSAKNEFRMVLNFAELLSELNRPTDAARILLTQVAREESAGNLLEARRFFRNAEDEKAIQATLVRLVETASNPRDAIAYRLQLAENFRENFETEKSAAVVAGLVKKFPANYGVLKEAENFYWDLGLREKSVEVLQAARSRARGEYLYQFNRKLAGRFNALNRPREAGQILVSLQTENPNDEEVFSELTDVYVRTKNPEALLKTFAATLEALSNQDMERLDFTWTVATLRKKMISAFTRMKDYDSAAEQYIEIINRDPEDEENTDEAISFAKRYGGAEKLLAYYRKTAAEGFKNYRWNVVLARIYEAEGDLTNASENYRTAIFNQPEMAELYDALGEIYLKMPNYEAALENVDKLLEMTGEDKKYVKQKAQILDKLGRFPEAEAERAKLPVETLPKLQTLQDKFAEAQNLRQIETEKAVEKYREAFENLSQNPFQNDIKSADIAAFVETVHASDTLGSITAKLWSLREKLTAEIENPDSLNSGKARENRKTLDGAITEAISREIKTKADGNEILALRADIDARLTAAEKSDSSTLSLLQNLISRCGFDDLQEKILVTAIENDSNAENQSQNLRAAVAFYQKRGNYRRILEILENDLAAKPLEFIRIYTDSARAFGEEDKELVGLQSIFAKQTTDDEFTKRYLEILYAKNRAELENLARNSNAHRLQIINFLLAKKETDLASAAIKNSAFSESWKLARAAETAFRLEKRAAENDADFAGALQISTIGELVKQNQDAKPQLTGADWFKFSNLYGQWLFAAGQPEKAEIFLAGKIENQPKSADEQFKLGYFYLEQKAFAPALEHFQIAAALRPEDKSFLPFLGAALFQMDEREKAAATWIKIIEGDETNAADALVYLKTLSEFGQSEKARRDVKPIFLAELKSLEGDEPEATANENLKEFTRRLAKSFTDERAKTAFFIEICRAVPKNTVLPEILIDESLVAKKDFGEFYRLLISRSEGFEIYEQIYEFVSISEESFETDDAETLYDSKNGFKVEEPENKKLEWQRKYLEYLLERGETGAAAKQISEIEDSLKNRYPRPVWLRLAGFRAALRQNQTTLLLSKMMKFSGVTVSPDEQIAVLPNLERLNEAVAILKDERRDDFAVNLQEAFFARQIALGQYDDADFAALAKIELQKGNAADALKILKLMTDFSADESPAQIDSMPIFAAYSNKENLPVETRSAIDKPESLRLAAEILNAFGFAAEAVLYRESLRDASPGDAANKIELARLYANMQRSDEAARTLLEIITNKRFDRKARWQSLLVLAETVGADENFMKKILAENQSLQSTDAELWAALQAFAARQSGNQTEAINLLQANDFTFEFRFLKAIFEKTAGRDEESLADLAAVSEAAGELEDIFGFYEAPPVLQQINLYLETGKPRAALDLAKNSGILKAVVTTDFERNQDAGIKPLAARAAELKFGEMRELLEKLRAAAETTGDFSAAIEFENAKSKFFETPEDVKNSEVRIENLRQKLSERLANQANSFVIDEKVLSDY